jgi:hypothetical protein
LANAFTARFRIVDNRNRDNDKAPDRKIPIDFTVEEARKASAYLLDAARKAEADGTTVRVYRSKDNYEEAAGFTTWASLWGDSGSWAPMAIATEDVF